MPDIISAVKYFMKESAKEIVMNFTTLYDAMQRCANGIRWKGTVNRYLQNGLINTYKLHQELMDGTYKIGPQHAFTVYEPKKREVIAMCFRDRLVQYALLEHYLYDELTRHFIYDNAAGQKDKGPDFATKRLKQMLARAYKKYGANTYAYTYDIKSFFGSTRHDVAKAAIEKRVKDEWAQSMVYQLIDSFSDGVGIGLGSDVAQFIELAVLDDLDHYIKEKMRIHHYVRYMDDFIIITNGKIHAQEYHEKISSELAKIGLRLHPRKCRVVPTKKGFKFLGFRFRQRPETGKIIMTLDKKKIYHERRKLKKMVKISKEGRIAKSVVDESLRGWEAHAKQGNNHRIIMKMHDYYNSLWRDENV